MSDERLRRADRLVELRSRAVSALQEQLALASQALAVAAAAAHVAQRAWEDRATTARAPSFLPAGDFAELHTHLRALRHNAASAAVHAAEAAAREEEQRKRLCDARAELRKIELWRERIVTQQAAIQTRLERVADDEAAARVARKER